jgi:NMD protein affecting ribosome stability and mRNA decay
MADVPHYCSACGEIHGGASRESEEVKIAKIMADKEIRIAELANRATTEVVEGSIEQTEIEAAAAVDEAVVKVEVMEELAEPPEPEPQPVTVVSNEAEGGDAEPEPEAEPPEAEGAPAAPVPSGSSNPWW